jgi:hypothetical protein
LGSLSNDELTIELFKNIIIYGDKKTIPLSKITITLPPTEQDNDLNLQQWIDLLNKIIENTKSLNTYNEIQRNLIWLNLLNKNNKIKLKDVLSIKSGTQIQTKINTSKNTILYPIYGGSIKDKYYNEFNCENNIIISKFDSDTNVKYITEKFFLNQNGWALNVNNKKYITEYVYIWLWYNQENLFLNDNNILHQTNFLNTSIYEIDYDLQKKIITEFNYYENLKNMLIEDNINLCQYEIIDIILKSYNNISSNIDKGGVSTKYSFE